MLILCDVLITYDVIMTNKHTVNSVQTKSVSSPTCEHMLLIGCVGLRGRGEGRGGFVVLFVQRCECRTQFTEQYTVGQYIGPKPRSRLGRGSRMLMFGSRDDCVCSRDTR